MRCRLCLFESQKDDIVELFQNEEESELTKLITKYIHLEINHNDTFSTVVCRSCVHHLNDFHEFIMLVERRQTELRNEFVDFKCILTENVNVPALKVKESMSVESNHESLLDIENVLVESEQNDDRLLKEEFAFDTYDDEDTNDPDVNNSGYDTPIEKDEDDMPLWRLLDKIENSKQSKRLIKQVSRLKCNPHDSITIKNKKGRPRKNKLVKTRTLKTKNSSIISEVNREGEDLILNCISLKCELCEAPANTLNELRTHFRDVHNAKPYVICCGRRFHRRFVLLDHLKYHLNPEHFKCEICNKVLKSKNCLENHQANMHSDKLERKHECEICGRRFARVSNLNSHKLTHVNSRDHICEICNKGFKSSNLLKNHIKYVHENKQPFICEICGQKYKFKPAFQRHVAEHDTEPNQLTEECPICKKWFRPNGLRFHMGRHDLEDVKCEICGKTVKSKLALKSHVKYWHKERKILKCTYCEKTFKRSSVLKEHIAMHTGQKDYSCPHCPREFRSKANMYSHIKKIHVEQWTQAQLVRTRGPNGILEKQENH